MKILDINEMLDAAHASKMPAVDLYQRTIEETATLLAEALAEHLGIKNREAKYEMGMGGLCACFYPAKKGQRCPPVIDAGDKGGDWEVA